MEHLIQCSIDISASLLMTRQYMDLDRTKADRQYMDLDRTKADRQYMDLETRTVHFQQLCSILTVHRRRTQSN